MTWAGFKRWTAANRLILINYMAIILATFMVSTIALVNLFFTCSWVDGDQVCQKHYPYVSVVIFQIVFNLFLFKRTLKNNHVAYWTLKSSSFMPEAITRHYSQSAPMPSYVTVDRLEEQTKKILQEIDPTDVLEDDRYYYQAHGLRTTDEPTKYCMACRCVAPRRAHHCPLCEICIIRKDHHCFFTGGCIGLANQRYFMMFCLWAGIGTLYGLWFSTRYMQMFVSEPWPFGFFKWLSPIAIGRWLGGYESMTTVLMSVFYTLNFGALFGTFGFFFAECFYTCVGYTMFDYHTGRLRDHIESDGENVTERIKLVFGKHWYLNVIFPLFWEKNELTPQIAKNIFLNVSKDL